MKKIFLRESALMLPHEVRMDFGRELSIVKISREEALAFDYSFKTADEMFARYGYDRRLKPEEHYEGYVAIWYASYMQKVAKMYGALRKATRSDVYAVVEAYIREAVRREQYWVMAHETSSEGIPIIGSLREMLNFQPCSFAAHIGCLQNIPGKEYLQDVAAPEAFSRSLKKKILDGALAQAPFEVTDDEYFVLRTYLGVATFEEYFLVVEE